MRKTILGFTALFLLLFSSHAFTQDACSRALILDRGQLDLAESSSMASARLYQMSSGSSENWAASIGVPIKLGSVTLTANQAKEYVNNYFEQSNIEWSQQRLQSVSTQTLSINSVNAYLGCINASKVTGTWVIPHQATNTAVTVTVRWVSPPMAPTTSLGAITIVGGTIIGAFPERWENAVSYSVVISRNDKEDIRVIANIGGDSDNILVAYIPIKTEPLPQLFLGSCVGKGGVEGLRFWGPKTEYCNGIRDWGRYDAQVQAVQAVGSCIGHGGVEGVTLYGPVGESCAGLSGNPWGVYGNPINLGAAGISYCKGNGNVIGDHILWGATGSFCGGFPGWGFYNQGTTKSN